MTEMLQKANLVQLPTLVAGTKVGAGAKAEAGRFDQVSIALHWLTVVLVVAQFLTAWSLANAGEAAPTVLMAHRSLGVLTWLIVAARLIWRRGFAHLPPFPASMPKAQQYAAKGNEYGLYALLLMQPLTGLGASLFRGRSFELFFCQAPALAPANKLLVHQLTQAHEACAAALLGLIGLHAAAALLHGVFLRDGVLQRMLPWTRR